jgi:hypothetical protein
MRGGGIRGKNEAIRELRAISQEMISLIQGIRSIST